MAFQYPQPRPAITVECVLLCVVDGQVQVLLAQRTEAPFEHRWSLPGGSVRLEESLEETVRRECQEQLGLELGEIHQLQVFGTPGRDPRERTLSIAFYALLPASATPEIGADSPPRCQWHPCQPLPSLAFDHETIVLTALERLRREIRTSPLAFELLPERFPLRDLQQIYEAVLGTPIDKRNFRKKLAALEIVKQLKDREHGVAHRAANLYQFDHRTYQKKRKQGQRFELS